MQTFIKTMLSFELQNVWKDCVVGGFEENYKNWDQKLFNCTFELAPLLVFLLRLSFLYPLTSKLVIYLCLYVCLSIYLNFSFYLFDFLLREMANASNGGWNLLSTRFSVPSLTSVKKTASVKLKALVQHFLMALFVLLLKRVHFLVNET